MAGGDPQGQQFAADGLESGKQGVKIDHGALFLSGGW